jgi:hypothetical protein
MPRAQPDAEGICEAPRFDQGGDDLARPCSVFSGATPGISRHGCDRRAARYAAPDGTGIRWSSFDHALQAFLALQEYTGEFVALNPSIAGKLEAAGIDVTDFFEQAAVATKASTNPLPGPSGVLKNTAMGTPSRCFLRPEISAVNWRV